VLQSLKGVESLRGCVTKKMSKGQVAEQGPQ
jgi:hypothetical protein